MLVENISPKMEVDSSFMKKVLNPYMPHTTYLTNASLVICYNDDNSIFAIKGYGDFSIPQSCYIDDTGHFNAVEFNICYNQLAYVTFAEAIKEGYLQKFSPNLYKNSNFELEAYLENQLSSMLIVKFNSKFLKGINSRSFSAEFTIEKISARKGSSFSNTKIEFFDDFGGSANGNILLAYANGNVNK